MPLVANSNLPAFEALRGEGETVLPNEVALSQDIRELHIGLLNMMPDTALAATERQFFRLVGESNQIAQFYMHPFTLAGLERGSAAREHIDSYYESFAQIRESGLDALIVTGANVAGTELSDEPFWTPLIEVIDWAYANVTSTLCSCLTTHAVLQFRYGQRRSRLPEKRWGVYSHRVVDRRHPLVMGVNTRCDVPHSRFNEISREQFAAAGLQVLIDSPEAGVHLAVSEDGFRLVFLQAHPEYDTVSLLKEYKREVHRFALGEREDYPPFPEKYFRPRSQAILLEHAAEVVAAKRRGLPPPELPEDLLIPFLDNTWHDTAEAVLNNWLGKVYQLTNSDRRNPFKDSVNPHDPLNLKGVPSSPMPTHR
jgi:homoserine O-succinyltransferase/O-acetyltransferase